MNDKEMRKSFLVVSGHWQLPRQVIFVGSLPGKIRFSVEQHCRDVFLSDFFPVADDGILNGILTGLGNIGKT
jgi:nitrate/nitrite transporter NarK